MMNKKDLWKALKTPPLSDYGCITCKHFKFGDCSLPQDEWLNCQAVGGRPENFYNPNNRWEWNGEDIE